MTEQKYRQRGYRGERPIGEPRRLRPFRQAGAHESAPGRGAERNREEVFRCKTCSEKTIPDVAPGSVCRKCGAALHACAQCRFFDGAAHWQCLKDIPAPVPAKSKANTCSFYAPKVSLDLTGAKAADSPDGARSAFDKLFGKR